MRKSDAQRVSVEVTSRVLAQNVQMARVSAGMPLENLLNDTLYNERKRLEREPASSVRDHDIAFWNEVSKALGRASEEQVKDLARRVIERYVLEIMGEFDETFYRLTTRILPVGLIALLNGVSPRRLLRGAKAFPRVEDSVHVEGEISTIKNLASRGTVILVPTHLSHTDSVLVGWALYHLGLPPFLYGAGLNLFANPVMGFFMSNLGAYKVDRKKNNLLYKQVLKTYATVALELGYHNLFFPGGTRSRSGEVERHLKLGLVSTGLQAYIRNLQVGKSNPNIYVVPATLNYPLVLEAETLIDDHLKEEGKARYIITDDEFSQPERVWTFFRNTMQLEARIHLRICEAFDVFGNPVDSDGNSRDNRGRIIDPSRYVMVHGRPQSLAQRDEQFTRELGVQIAASYMRNNTLFATHVLAFVVFRLLRNDNPGLDLYRLLRTGGNADSIELGRIYDAVEALVSILAGKDDANQLRLTPNLRSQPAHEIVAEALKYFGTYHLHHVLERRGDRVFPTDMNLLYYYQNRLSGYGLEQVLDAALRSAA